MRIPSGSQWFDFYMSRHNIHDKVLSEVMFSIDSGPKVPPWNEERMLYDISHTYETRYIETITIKPDIELLYYDSSLGTLVQYINNIISKSEDNMMYNSNLISNFIPTSEL